MHIPRDFYLQELLKRRHNGMVKIVTGLRRCGKSYLIFNIWRDYLLKEGVPPAQIISLSLEDLNLRHLLDPYAMLSYVKSQIQADRGWHYLLIDEVQLLERFVEVLLSLMHVPNLDIYVTGSNARFLSVDVVTEFRGRGDEVHLYPLSFAEYLPFTRTDRYQSFNDYLVFGGLPMILSMQDESQKTAYLEAQLKSTYLKDIIERHGITRTLELDHLLSILASTIGSLTNPSRIQQTFSSVLKSQLSFNTVKQYLDFFEDSFLVSQAKRFDIKGRRYVGSPVKYYFEDTGVRNAALNFSQSDEYTHLMENAVYNELRKRGYAVDVGQVYRRVREQGGARQSQTLEIDFVARRGSHSYYLQSAYHLAGEGKTAQEKLPLLCAGNSFKKIVVTADAVSPTQDLNGITTINIYDFFLKENSLEL